MATRVIEASNKQGGYEHKSRALKTHLFYFINLTLAVQPVDAVEKDLYRLCDFHVCHASFS